MLRGLVSILLLMIITKLHAQKVDPPQNEKDWIISRDPKNILYVSSTEAIAGVFIGKNDAGLIKFNSEGKELWKSELGYVKTMGIKEGKIFAFQSNPKMKKATLSLNILDAKTGKEVTAMEIYETNHEYEAKAVPFPSGDLNYLFLRQSGRKFNGGGDFQKTDECLALYFDKSGKQTKSVKLPLPPASEFIGEATNANGDIILAYIINGKLMLSQYNSSGNQVATLEMAFPYSSKHRLIGTLKADEKEAGKFWITCNYVIGGKKEYHQVFGFDFNSKKTLTSGEEELGESYCNTMEHTTAPGTIGYRPKTLSDVKPVGLLSKGEKIIMLEQISSSEFGQSAVHYGLHGLYITFYTRELKKLKTISLDKYYESFLSLALSSGFHLDGEKLYLTANALINRGSCANLFCVVNTETMKFDTIKILDKGPIKSIVPIECGSTLWFGNKIWVSYIIPEGIGSNNINSALQKITLD